MAVFIRWYNRRTSSAENTWASSPSFAGRDTHHAKTIRVLPAISYQNIAWLSLWILDGLHLAVQVIHLLLVLRVVLGKAIRS